MSIIECLRKALKTARRHQMILNDVLVAEGGFVFNWQPVWEKAGHLSNKKQCMLGRLICGYVNGYTVTVHDEYGFMECAVKAFNLMKNPYDQDEFDALMNKN